MESRAELSKEGIGGPLLAVAERLEHCVDGIRDAPLEVVRGYHSWFERSSARSTRFRIGGSGPVGSALPQLLRQVRSEALRLGVHWPIAESMMAQ